MLSMSTSALEKVQATITRYHLLSLGDTVLVAVSGGADSVALLHLLGELRAKLGIDLHVAHLNHGLRPDADEDAAYVQQLAGALNVPVTTETTDIRRLAVQQKRSVEDAGRSGRYAFFARVAAHVGARRVATAHTRDDQTETVLMRLLQGTSWDALAGIPPARPLGSAMVVRPLWELTRVEVVEYLQTRRLRWHEDPTNRDRRFLRNQIRLDVLPALEQHHPLIRSILWDLGEMMWAGEEFLSGLTQELFGHITRQRGGSVSLSLKEFQRVPVALQQRLVRRAVQHVTGTNTPLPRVIQERAVQLAARGRPGSEADLGPCLVRCGYEVLEILPHQPQVAPVHYHLQVPGSVVAEAFGIVVTAEILEGTGRPGANTPNEVYLDAAKVGHTLHLRAWRQGDWFIPLGMYGKKKLQDFFVDEKVPRWDRRRIPLITGAQDRIVWVVGRRLDESTRATETTTRVVRLRATPM